MIEIVVPEQDLFIENEGRFLHVDETALCLEHSLISLRKWEGAHHKAFLAKENKTVDEVLDYIRCMTLNRYVKPEVYLAITPEIADEIIQYINDPRTAATFSNSALIGAAKYSGEFISAETIYYWMIELQIPVEFEKWHLNQLLALIKFVSIKSSPQKKMSAKEAAAQRKALNEARRARYKTSG